MEHSNLNENSSNSNNVVSPQANKKDTSVSIVMSLLMSMAASALSVGAYHVYQQRNTVKPIPVAYVDIVSISNEMQKNTREEIQKIGNASEAERDAVMKSYEAKMYKLKDAIAKVGAECGCTLLIKDAVLNSATMQNKDLTAKVKAVLSGQSNAAEPAAAAATPAAQ